MGQSMFVCCWQYLEDREKFMFQDKNNNSKREILYELQDTALIEKKKRGEWFAEEYVQYPVFVLKTQPL